MKSILFIFNGLTRNQGKVGISGGDIRLAEIAKNTDSDLVNLLTTTNGEEFAEKMNVKYTKKFVINYSIGAGIWSNLKISLLSLFALPKGLKDFRNQIVYSSCEHLYDVLPALRLKFLNKCEWLAVYHWVEDFPWKEKRGGTPFLKRYAYWLNRAFSGWLIKMFADQILAVSDQTKEKLIQMKNINPEKIKAVYCGVEYDKIVKIGEKYEKEKGLKYDAVYMKRLNNGKGVFDLLEIWEKACKENNKLKLAIIGDGPEDVVNQIKDFIAQNNLTKNIFLLGVIYDFEEKFRVLNSAKLFVLPTHEENWAIVIGEAMAIKIPVICYRLKEIEPIWKDNVEWVKKGNTREFANKVLMYLKDKEKALTISQKAFSFIKQYDWKVISKTEFDN